METAT